MSADPYEALAAWFDLLPCDSIGKEHYEALRTIASAIERRGERVGREACAQILTDYMARYGKPGYPINIRKMRDAMLARGWQGGEQ